MQSRPFLLLVRHWLWLLAAGTVGAAIAFWMVARQPQTYLAQVDVIPKRARTEVNYDSRIRTVSSEGGGTQVPGQPSAVLQGASFERRQALAQLVKSPDIERMVLQDLGEALPVGMRSRGSLLPLVFGSFSPRNEVISIIVQTGTPTLAEQIAGSWAKAYERHVNELYAGPPNSSALSAEVASAQKKYGDTQAALAAFLGSSSLGEDSRLLDARQQSLRSITAARQTLAPEVSRFRQLSQQATRVELVLGDVKALQRQILAARDNSSAASNALALSLLKVQAFASSRDLAVDPANQGVLDRQAPQVSGTGASAGREGSGSLDVALALAQSQTKAQGGGSTPPQTVLQFAGTATPMTLEQQRTDVAAMVTALEDWRAELLREIDSLMSSQLAVSSSTSQTDEAVRGLEQEIRLLQARVSEQTGIQRHLEQERDVAWETYSNLLKRAEEARVASAVGSGNEVALANETVIAFQNPPRQLLPRLVMFTGMGVAAAAAGIIVLSVLPELYLQSVHRTRVGLDDPAPAA